VRIAYLCCDFGVPICGTKGASVHVRELVRALADRGHVVVVLTPRQGGEPPADFPAAIVELPLEGLEQQTYSALRNDVRAGPVAAREIRALLYARSLRSRAIGFLEGFQPDLIYERYSLFARAGGALARDLDVPHVLEVNAPLTDEEALHRGLRFEQSARRQEREILRGADHVVTVSRELERWAIGLGVEPERVLVLPNAVDPARFDVPRVEAEQVRAELGVAGQPLVVFVGGLRPWHDTRSLVRAIGLLHRKGLPAHLLIVGDGPDRAALRDLAESESLGAHVIFTGAVRHEIVPLYLAASDVAVASYDQRAGFYFSPLKLFEYLAAARPVVAANIGEIGHCVRPDETGLLYAPGDAGELADALEVLLSDPMRAEALGRAGREHVAEHHTWERNARAVEELATGIKVMRPLSPAAAGTLLGRRS
jgi:glycosyltransferase involved in cell wall biosynthesis